MSDDFDDKMFWDLVKQKPEGLTVEKLKQAKRTLDEITYPCNGIDYTRIWRSGHRVWLHRWTLLGTDHYYELAHKDEAVDRRYHEEAMFNLYTAPTKETKLNVKENAAQYLDQVKSHLANVEGQLASTKAQLDIRTRELKDAKAVTTQPDERALYVNLDGTTRNAPVMVERRLDLRDGYAPMREVRFEELQPGSIIPLVTREQMFDPRYALQHYRRIYRLTFSQRGLHVYQEIG